MKSFLKRLKPRALPRLPRAAVSFSNTADVAATIERALKRAGLQPTTGTTRDPAVASRVAKRTASPVASRADAPSRGRSLPRSYANAAGTRAYTLHVPPDIDPQDARPLLLMLHGCTQDPDDFARGTRMNALADRHGVLVAYPAQTARDNGSRCWNWFRRQDQLRDAGEPSILAGIVADIAADHRVDARRVYVAGLSAGAAMAVILGRTYPDVFAAVGSHSGLPFGAAHDVPGAFAAMQGTTMKRRTPPSADASSVRGVEAVPTIVFHGDADRTVHARNGEAIVLDAVGDSMPVRESTESNANGRGYRRDVFVDARDVAQVEHWTLHGGAHAWSGGDPSGSHVDASGPDASAEMLRFFLQHARD